MFSFCVHLARSAGCCQFGRVNTLVAKSTYTRSDVQGPGRLSQFNKGHDERPEGERTVLETELAVASLDRFLANRGVTTPLLASPDPRRVQETSTVLAALLSQETSF